MEDFKPEAWAVNSTNSTNVSLVDTKEGKIASFKPSFTYPIFGETEQVFGYKNLEMILAFDSRNFTPFLNVKYTEKLDDDLLLEKAKMDLQSEKEPIEFDPLKKLLQFLPENDLTIKNEAKWTEQCSEEGNLVENILQKDGEKITSDEKSTVYKITITKFKQIHDRIKIFTLLFIEGASYIQDDDEVWDVYVILENKTSKIIGYATCYKYWFYDGKSKKFDSLQKLPEDYSYKGRISQFIIFPTFQNQKFGSRLYNSIYEYWLKQDFIKQINIEDPNESFDALRDKNDFQRIIDSKFDTKISTKDFQNSNVSKKNLESDYIDLLDQLRNQFKFEPKQAQRLLEMIFIYLNLDDFIRLVIIKRVYKQNYELLLDFDKEDRNEKLEETCENIKQEYFERIPSLIQKDDVEEPPKKKSKL
ncbi:acyl-CoA N-acyltransferase [Hanseniaspora valbyensis NRRL Y-1626]|uniref:Histone acetyltransferase type B catalytic subunit n=1 Tax=Hanseniaspora valbyensis NRRL Y-1626 TaxID=766949 RepID=A0A1B7TA02_9ASCO|nr:acyl-CoA N-acyltransferase [Hanseniaspora valbyensis NRRL Y-1626]